MRYEKGEKIEALGRKRCVKIVGEVTGIILGGYEITDKETGFVYYVRHEDFDIREVEE
jgi:hypothetical protein